MKQNVSSANNRAGQGKLLKLLWDYSIICTGIVILALIVALFAVLIPSGNSILNAAWIILLPVPFAAVIGTLFSAIGFFMVLRKKDRIQTSMKYEFLAFLIIGIVGFIVYTAPFIGQISQSISEAGTNASTAANTPKTAEEWLLKEKADYAVVKASVDNCKIVSVKTSTRYILQSNIEYIHVTVEPGEGEQNQSYYALPLEDRSRLQSDLDAAGASCGYITIKDDA